MKIPTAVGIVVLLAEAITGLYISDITAYLGNSRHVLDALTRVGIMEGISVR